MPRHHDIEFELAAANKSVKRTSWRIILACCGIALWLAVIYAAHR